MYSWLWPVERARIHLDQMSLGEGCLLSYCHQVDKTMGAVGSRLLLLEGV